MRDARGQHARLAGPGTGENQNRPVERLDRVALLGIEPGQIGRGRRRARPCGDAAGGWLMGCELVRSSHQIRMQSFMRIGIAHDGTVGPRRGALLAGSR